VRWNPNVFIFISFFSFLLAKDIQHLFMCLLAICISFSVQLICPFINWICILLLFSFFSSCIFWILILCQVNSRQRFYPIL
jgi:hypothetical protein